ncbi:DUF6227 family protein [Streptomyces sp. JJ36]|uniref:DUF6227 family protein n=1 Tax=Streptomyces sp. JJ36 TaxID=2736645 RepID=UPI001F339D1D|nr:DUF6227 family protein [Streptomyces sp. JJ36]MCF6525361.1 hypothetical protein [Streptomyces sp. JJ36]
MGETLDATPARHLEMLLARAQNPFDVSESVLGRLRDAVLCRVEMQARRHLGTPPLRSSSYRHAFLLADGSCLTLWELRHEYAVGGPGGDAGAAHGTPAGGTEPRSEIYECEEALRVSQRRLRPEDGGGCDTGYAADAGHGADAAEHGPLPYGWGPALPDEGFLDLPQVTGPAPRRYAQGDSADHARRLLRRAENPDRPGEEVLRLLATARGHDIVHVPGPHACSPAHHVWCSVYEHAFLLADGSEFSLYELEHNLSGTGRLVCEVYPEQATAARTALLRARERGIEL